MTIWLRGKRIKKRKVHIEVRDPKMALELVKTYRGKDHTFHIILKEKKTD